MCANGAFAQGGRFLMRQIFFFAFEILDIFIIKKNFGTFPVTSTVKGDGIVLS